jgi:hypothetical protein
MDTYKGYTYSKSIWYVFSFNLDPFVDMNFITDTYRGYAYTNSIWSHFFLACLKHIPKL